MLITKLDSQKRYALNINWSYFQDLLKKIDKTCRTSNNSSQLSIEQSKSNDLFDEKIEDKKNLKMHHGEFFAKK